MWFAPAIANDTGNYMYNIGDLGISKSLELCPLLLLDVNVHAPVVTLNSLLLSIHPVVVVYAWEKGGSLYFYHIPPCQLGWLAILPSGGYSKH